MAQSIASQPDRPVLFLSREGYHLRRLVGECLTLLGLPTPPLHYLIVSRTLIFRLLLATEQDWQLGLQAHFQGSLDGLLRERFGLRPEEIRALMAPSLPLPLNLFNERDQSFAREFLQSRRHLLLGALEPRLSAYRSYVNGLSQSRPFTVVDIGFSGTIQKGLSAIMPAEIDGLYFYFLGEKNGKSPNLPAKAFWRDRGGFGSGDPLIDFSLVLESILTSPHGQVVDIDANAAAPYWQGFTYKDGTEVQRSFHVTYAMLDGVLDYARQMILKDISPTQIDEVLDVGVTYGNLLKFEKSDEMDFFRSFCEIDDAISGNGTINPFTHLPGLSTK